MSASDHLEAAGRNVGQLRECVELMQANLGDTVKISDEGLGSSGRAA